MELLNLFMQGNKKVPMIEKIFETIKVIEDNFELKLMKYQGEQN